MSSLTAAFKRIPERVHRWARNTLLTLVAVFILFCGVAVFLAPGWIKPLIEQQAREQTGRKLSVGALHINPLRLSVRLDDIKLFEPDGTTPTLTADTLTINASTASIFRRAAVLDAIKLVHPVFNIVRSAPQRFNFSDIVDKILAQPKSDQPVHFSLNNIEVENGQINLDDQVGQRQHRIEALHLGIPFISDLPYATDIFVEPVFEARINGSPIALHGRSKPFASSLDSIIDISLNDIDLPALMGFSPVPLNFKLANGKLSSQLELVFRKATQTEINLSGTFQLADIKLTDHQNQNALAFNKLAFALEKVDVLKPSASIKNIQLDTPQIYVHREKDGSFNLPQIFSVATTQSTAPAPTQSPSSSPSLPASSSVSSLTTLPAIDIAQIDVNNGSVFFSDASFAQPFQTTLKDIHIGVSGLSSTRATPAKVQMTMQTEHAEMLEQQGEFSLRDHSASGQLSLRQFQPTHYAAFTAAFLLARIEDGSIDFSGHYAANWSQANKPDVKLDELALNISKLRLRMPDEKEALFNGEQIAATGGHFDLVANTFSLDQIKLTAPQIGVKRDAKGTLNLLAMLAAKPKTTTAAATTTPASAPQPTVASAAPAPPMSVMVKDLQIERGVLRFDDLATPVPVSLRADNFNLSAQNLGTAKGISIPFDLKTGFNRNGQLKVKGNVAIEPLSITASINASKLGLASLQGYLADRLNVTITNADLSLRGTAHVGLPLKLAFSAPSNTTLNASFKGSADLTNFTALDKVNGEEFLRWKNLKLGQIEVQLPAKTAPLLLGLSDIALSDFYARVIINSTGRLNVQDVMTAPGTNPQTQSITTATTETPPQAATPKSDIPKDQPAPAPTASSQPAPIIRIGQVTLLNGNINFTDNFIRPNYSANLTELAGSISGVASDQPTPADVNIRGSIDGDGALAIAGKINPLGAKLYTDITASATDIELTKLTPYAIKYAGYAIEKGKLSMKVSYKIENDKLEANNNLYLDQLTFGERVDSPTATTLPVRFAISLLKDGRGVIDVDLPISGTLSDPQFSMGGLIVRVIVNLLTKAITSPFSLIASAFGGGDELGSITFAPGSTTVTAAEQTKIEKLSKALADRPSLKLDISGRVDAETDREGARRLRLSEKVRAQKIKDLGKNSEEFDPSTVKVEANEYPKYLERVYSDEKFSKPRNLIGIAKNLPPEEMEKLILTNTNITDDDLRALANQRAATVRSLIEKANPSLGERVFLVAPKLTVDADEKDKGKTSRVDFSLH